MTDDKGPLIETLGWSMGSISFVMVVLRMWIRFLVVRKPGWDDFFIVFSLLAALTCTALDSVGVHYGLGRHYSTVTDATAKILAVKYTVLPSIFCMISTTTGKISIVFFLLKLLGHGAQKWQKWFLWILTFLLVGTNIECIIVIIGFCIPAEKIWNPSVSGHCMTVQQQLVGAYIQASYNAVSDLVLALFPITIFWPLNMDLKTKLSLTGFTGCGVFAAAATTVKAVLLKDLPNQTDITWEWASITVWYTAEMYVIIICATVPALKPLYNIICGKALSKNSGAASYDMNVYSRSHGTMPLTSQHHHHHMTSVTKVGDEVESNECTANGETSSQENILPRNKGDINIVTDVSISYGQDVDGKNGRNIERSNVGGGW